LFHEFFRWLQEDLGANLEAGTSSWSQQILGSLNIWPLLEGTHVLALMLFAGTIWIVDLRMMGVAFRNVPFSRLNDKVLPFTIAGLAILFVTGIILFLAKPMVYYHSVWFRFKMVFLLFALVNILVFHRRIQATQDQWDELPTPPNPVRLSGAISLVSWVLIIVFGRFIAYNWLDCGKPQPAWVNVVAECAAYPGGIVTSLPEEEEGPLDEAAPIEETTDADNPNP
jgi:hypothetical protein